MIGVYGATGILGALVTARLDRLGASTVLIGGSQAALAPLTQSERLTAVATVDDSAALERALDGCHVLVNCAPAESCGERLVRAALDAGIHYVEAAGEQHHIRNIFEKYDEEATQCDVAVIPALGFEFAIGDCLAHLAASPGESAANVVVAYAVEDSDLDSAGAQGAARKPGGQEFVYRDGHWRPVPFEIDRAWYDFPDPIGSRQMSRYGSGEVITVPRHVKTQSVTTLITSASLCPYPALLPVLPIVRPVLGLVRRTPARAIFGLVARAFGKSRGEAAASSPHSANLPSPSNPANRGFMVAAEVHGGSGWVSRAVAAGANVRNVTAAILAQGALWLSAGSVVAGVHSAATAFEPHALLDSLASDGVRWSHL